MKEFITVQEAAKKAGISVVTFYYHIEKGSVPYTRTDIMGKAHYKIPTAVFIEWLKKEAAKSQSKIDMLNESMEDLRNGR